MLVLLVYILLVVVSQVRKQDLEKARVYYMMEDYRHRLSLWSRNNNHLASKEPLLVQNLLLMVCQALHF